MSPRSERGQRDAAAAGAEVAGDRAGRRDDRADKLATGRG